MALIERRIEGEKVTCLYKSATVLQTEYNMNTRILEVTFRNGQKYRYHVVTPMEHAGLQIAESAGKYLHKTFTSKKYEKLGSVLVEHLLRKVDGYVIR
jgi:hypothetical protein